MNAGMPFDRLLADLPKPLAEDAVFMDELERCARIVTVRKGEILLHSGECCSNAYFINKGLFVTTFITEQGRECVVGFASDMQYPFLSDISYITQKASDFEIKALEDGELLCFTRSQIGELLLRFPLFSSYYLHVMQMIISKQQILFATLQSYTAEELIKYLYEQHKWIINRVPDKYIARYMGISTSWYCKLKKRIL